MTSKETDANGTFGQNRIPSLDGFASVRNCAGFFLRTPAEHALPRVSWMPAAIWGTWASVSSL